MFSAKPSVRLILFALAASFTALVATTGIADDKEKPAQPATSEADEFAVPQDADINQLVDFVRTMLRREPKGETEAEQIADYLKAQQAAAAAADKLYELSLTDKERGRAVAVLAAQVKYTARQHLKQLAGDVDSIQLKAFAEKLIKDKRETIADIGNQILLELRFELPPDADDAAVKKLADDLRETFGDGDIAADKIRIIMEALQQLEVPGRYAAAAELYRFFAKRFSESTDEEVLQTADRFEGTARRMELPGNPIEVSGTFLDGTKLDWPVYKGKVVLIDFWATWCGPCVAELPNVLANYEKYHDRGFDVVAISLDSDREKVEAFVENRKLPWKTLFSDDPEANGWKHPVATQYGIGAIPAVLLVDQKGNVVSLNARGPELGRLLGELLGDAATPSE